MAGGAYTIDFAAADPSDYIPPIPFPGNVTPIVGRGDGDSQIPDAYHTSPITNTEVNVESLAPEDMALGQIVPFEIKITVDGDTQPEDGQINFSSGWNIDTTNNADFGYDESFGVIAAFIDTGDGGHLDPGNDATVDSFNWSVVGDQIQGTFNLSGLDDGDMVVVEAWLVLEDSIPAGSTGNVQSGLIEAATAADDTINTGKETVPLLRVQQFFTADADLSVTKTDDPDPVNAGDTLTYTITVLNEGPSIANNVMVVDDLDPNTTFVSASDGGVFSDGGTPSDPSDDTVTWDLGALVPGVDNQQELTVTVTVNDDAPTAGTEDLLNTVTVTSITDDPDQNNNTDTEPTDVLDPFVPDPAISIIKTGTFQDENGDGNADVGETISYSFTVANQGNVDLTGVSVTDPSVTVNGGPIDLAVGGSDSTTFTGSYTITQPDIDAGEFVNQATATGTDPNGNPVTDLSDDNSPLEDDPTVTPLPNPAISIIKTGTFQDENGDGNADVGETISYSFTVANQGNVDLTGVSVTDPSVTVNGGPIDLAVGGSDSTTFTGSYTITQPDIDAGEFVNQATATGTDPNGNPVTDLSDDNSPLEDDPTVTPLPNPAISIIKTGTFQDENGDGNADVGETISYSFTVANQGNVDLTGVSVTDPSVTVNGGPIDLAVGGSDSTTFTGSYTITQPDIDAGEFVNQATATGTDPNGNPVTDLSDDNSPLEDDPTVTPLPQNPDLDLVKDVELTIDADFSDDTSAGDTLTYTFTIKNTGNVTLTNVTLEDPLPGLSAIDFGTFDGSLAPGETVEGTATYTVTQTDVENGDIINEAKVTAEAPGGDPDDDTDNVTDTDTETVDLPQPALEIDKKSELLTDADGSQDISAGDTIRYTIDVSNTGTANLTGVTVFDSLADDFLTLSDVAGDGADFLAAGNSETATFDYVVQESDLGTTIVNTATADSVQTNSVQDTENVSVPVPGLTIDKMFTGFDDIDGNGEVTQGDILNYDITVTSSGTANLTNVTVDDAEIPFITTIPFLGAGLQQVFPVSYEVTEQDALTGEFVNTAVANSNQTDSVQDDETVPVKLGVDIDIKPGSDPSSFNLKGNGTVPVAILGTAEFDATTIESVTLEEFVSGDGDPLLDGVAETTDINFSDVNGDGFLDAVAKFRKPNLRDGNVEPGLVLDTESTFAKLTGLTDDGLMLIGIGDVNVTQI